MLDHISSLARAVTLRKGSPEKYVLMLGAGASIASGVPTTAAIVRELTEQYGTPSTEPLDDRFDALWRTSNGDKRRLMLAPYLERTPSRGYRFLADLIARGYFDVVVTFNFDCLLERSLDAIGFSDYKAIIRGEVDTQAIDRLVRSTQPRVKIVKMHGGLLSADYFLFSREEMLNYPPVFSDLLKELTGRDIVICGYAFNDTCVVRAFNESREAGAIHFVNPEGTGANQHIKGFLIARRSQDKVISGPLGRFDDFFETLHRELTKAPAPQPGRAKQNVFKFLDHYHEDQRPWFMGRRQLTRAVVRQFESGGPPLLFLHGKEKVGKTSFIRAGLIPYLSERYECVYVRCGRELEAQLRGRLSSLNGGGQEASPWRDVLQHLAEKVERPIVLFLDQFERPARLLEHGRADKSRTKAALDFITETLQAAGPRLRVVCAAIDDVSFWKLIARLPIADRNTLEIDPLPPERVASIIRHSARRGGVTLPAQVIEDVCRDYRRTMENPSERPITLTHVQTICYYLVKGCQPVWEGYDRLPNQGLLAALEPLRDQTSLVDLVDDLPPEERRLIRSFLKVICDPKANTRQIVEFIRDHFPDIREDRFPEPLA